MNVDQRADSTTVPVAIPRFRMIAFQPLSFALENKKPFVQRIGEMECTFFSAPAHDDATKQRSLGGTWIHVEFGRPGPVDLLRATGTGVELVENLLSGIAVVTGMTFGASRPVQITDVSRPERVRFANFISTRYAHCEAPVSASVMNGVRRLLLHWDGLEDGARIRRAAHYYMKALTADDDVEAFQDAYLGLESLEPTIAKAMKVTPGAEEVTGTCASCGFEYKKRRTVLNGVRAYLDRGHQPHVAQADGSKTPWRIVSELRTVLFHGLNDPRSQLLQAEEANPLAMSALHDGICCTSHAHALEVGTVALNRTPQLLAVGDCVPKAFGTLDEWRRVLEDESIRWVPDSVNGHVPEIEFRNDNFKDVRARFYWLSRHLSVASESDLAPAEGMNVDGTSKS